MNAVVSISHDRQAQSWAQLQIERELTDLFSVEKICRNEYGILRIGSHVARMIAPFYLDRGYDFEVHA